MTVSVVSNKKNLSATVHLNATGTVTVQSLKVGDEVLTGLTIDQVFAGCASGTHVTIKRGGELVGLYDSTGWYDYSGCGMQLSLYPTEDLEITFSGEGYIMIELKKIGTFTSEYLRA